MSNAVRLDNKCSLISQLFSIKCVFMSNCTYENDPGKPLVESQSVGSTHGQSNLDEYYTYTNTGNFIRHMSS